MRRWMLYFIGAVLLAEPSILRQVRPHGILDVVGWASVPSNLPTWLRISVFAGAYLVEWATVLGGLLIVFYAGRNRR